MRLTRRILVVEDQPINQMFLCTLLERLGHTYVACKDGLEALDAMAREEFLVVLMDCQMPRMDGYESARQRRQFEQENASRRVPIIAVTAHAVPGDRERCMAAGMDDYLTKPFTKQQIVEVLSRWA